MQWHIYIGQEAQTHIHTWINFNNTRLKKIPAQLNHWPDTFLSVVHTNILNITQSPVVKREKMCLRDPKITVFHAVAVLREHMQQLAKPYQTRKWFI